MSVPLPVIPGYQVERVLGAGGMAAVYLAVQDRLQRKVAIKLMANTLSLSESFRQRFLNEARLCAQLTHPNIMRIHDSGEVDGALFMVTEYMDGGTLREQIDAGIEPSKALDIIEKLAGALEEAHELRVWHRDIKPENILFDRKGRFVLADFGIAKDAGDTGPSLTGTGNVVGTPHYMSPEQFRAGAMDGRSDIYSLGVLLYEMLTLTLPFQSQDMYALAMLHLASPVPRLPDDLAVYQSLIDRMLAKEPADRFESCAELRAALLALQASGNSSPTIGIKSPLQRSPNVAVTAASKRPDSKASRWMRPAIALLAVAVVSAIMSQQLLNPRVVPPQSPIEATAAPDGVSNVGAAQQAPSADDSGAQAIHSKTGSEWKPTVLALQPGGTEGEPDQTVTSLVGSPRVESPRALNAVNVAELTGLADRDLEARLGAALRGGQWKEWESSLAALSASDRNPVARHRRLFDVLQTAGLDLSKATSISQSVKASVVSELELSAKAQLAAGRKGRPSTAGDNAVDSYRMMLAVDPESPAATAGLQQLSADFLAAAATAASKENTVAARKIYDRALAMDPENEAVRELQMALGE